MLKSYEAILERNQSVRWLTPAPPRHVETRIIIVMAETHPVSPSSSPSSREILRRTRGAWGRGKTIEEVDAEIQQMRSEWEREWN